MVKKDKPVGFFLPLLVILKWVSRTWSDSNELFFSLIELYHMRILYLMTMIMFCVDVNISHFVLLLLLVVTIGTHSSVQRFTFKLLMVLLSILFLMQMTYQLEVFPTVQDTDFENKTCVGVDELDLDFYLHHLHYFGIRKLGKGEILLEYLAGHTLALAMLTLSCVVFIRQRYEIFFSHMPQISFTCLVIVIFMRMDVFSLLYSLWLTMLVFLPRESLSRVWWLFTLYTAACVIVQYILSLGNYVKICFGTLPSGMSIFWKFWLYFPTNELPTDPTIMIGDCVLLMLAARQYRVFIAEEKPSAGGSNDAEYLYFNDSTRNPVPDHMTYLRTNLDFVKRFLTTIAPWLTIGFGFLTGARVVNLFSWGYLFGSFAFLWIEVDLCLLKPHKKIIQRWNIMLIYVVFVITSKSIYEIFVCVYFKKMDTDYCWIVKLMKIVCSNRKRPGIVPRSSRCPLSSTVSPLWDTLYFCILIFYIRYLQSYYFLRYVQHNKAMSYLQSKGAELIEKLLNREKRKTLEAEENVLAKIRQDIVRIRGQQGRIRPWQQEETNHFRVIKSGDYVMFEDSDLFTDFDEGIENTILNKMRRRKRTITETLLKLPSNYSKTPDRSREGRGKISKVQSRISKSASQTNSTAFEELPNEEEEVLTCCERCKKKMENIILSFIALLDKYSKKYIIVAQLMNIEKSNLKRSVEKPIGSLMKKSQRKSFSQRFLQRIKPKKDTEPDSELFVGHIDDTLPDYAEEKEEDHNSILRQLFTSLWYFVLSQSEMIVYLITIIHFCFTTTILSVFLSLFMFLWGLLTKTRPTKTFWVTMMAYLEAIILLQLMVEHEVLPVHEHASYFIFLNPYNPALDLTLLVFLFFHRYQLKTFGLWKGEWHGNLNTLSPTDGAYYDVMENSEDFQREIQSLAPTVTKENEKFLTMFHRNILYADKLNKTIENENAHQDPFLTTYDGRLLKPLEEVTSEDVTPPTAVYLTVDENSDETPMKPTFRLTLEQHLYPYKKFFYKFKERGWRFTYDYYTIMFLLDFFNFLLLLFGYNEFMSEGASDIHGVFIIKNRVPPHFLMALISHFFVIVIDRVFYLKRNLVAKLILHILMVLSLHSWALFYSHFRDRIIPKVWFFAKSLNLLLSGYQIREGYPTRVHGYFCCKKYGFYKNYILFKILQFIPFFYELRNVINWTCTKSSLSLYSWLKLENVYCLAFELKCILRNDDKDPRVRGRPCDRNVKLNQGLPMFFLVALLIWFPLICFAIIGSTAKSNPPKEVTLNINFNYLEDMYTVVCSDIKHLYPLPVSIYNKLIKISEDNSIFLNYLRSFYVQDIYVASFSFESEKMWIVSPIKYMRLLRMAHNGTFVHLTASWSVVRTMAYAGKEQSFGENDIKITSEVTLHEIEMILSGNSSQLTAKLDNIFPMAVVVGNNGEIKPITNFFGSVEGTPYVDVNFALKTNPPDPPTPDDMVLASKWWIAYHNFTDEQKDIVQSIPLAEDNKLTMLLFNEKSEDHMFQYFTTRGILGLYFGIGFVLWRLLKVMFRDLYPRIKYSEIPNINYVLQLCYDIYLVRENEEFGLEEELYAKMLFLFRSPETMIRFTPQQPIPYT